MGIKPTPKGIIKSESFDAIVSYYGKSYEVNEDEEGSSISMSGHISLYRLEEDKEDYVHLRESLLNVLTENSVTIEDYLDMDKHSK